MDLIQITSRISEKEWIQYNFHFFFKRLTIRILLMILMVCIVLFTIGIVYNKTYSDFSIFIVIFSVVLYWSLLMSILYYRAIKTYKNNQHKISEIHYSFRHDGFSYHNKLISADIKWDAIYKIEETKRWILIYHNERAANIIVKEQLPSEQLFQFYQLINNLNILRKKIKS